MNSLIMCVHAEYNTITEEFMLGRTDGGPYSEVLVPARSAMKSDEVSRLYLALLMKTFQDGNHTNLMFACVKGYLDFVIPRFDKSQ